MRDVADILTYIHRPAGISSEPATRMYNYIVGDAEVSLVVENQNANLE